MGTRSAAAAGALGLLDAIALVTGCAADDGAPDPEAPTTVPAPAISATAPVCDTDTVTRDLDPEPPMADAAAVVDHCDGDWAVVRWDSPGDNQRIVRWVDGRWTTYVRFPHELCWPQADADGVPPSLTMYFQIECAPPR